MASMCQLEKVRTQDYTPSNRIEIEQQDKVISEGQGSPDGRVTPDIEHLMREMPLVTHSNTVSELPVSQRSFNNRNGTFVNNINSERDRLAKTSKDRPFN